MYSCTGCVTHTVLCQSISPTVYVSSYALHYLDALGWSGNTMHAIITAICCPPRVITEGG